MVPARLLRIINVSIGVLVILIALIVYWYAIRPLPKTSGEMIAPISGDATIERDALGVPHITASSWQDAIFLQGFATAQDRLWQMDGLRRFGAGELAEVFGPGAIQPDEQSRRMRMRAIAEADVQRLRPEERAVLVAYAKGVNYFIDTHRGDYQLEFSLPGHAYDPRPWTLTDSVLVGLVMFRDLTDSSHFELTKGAVLTQGGDAAKLHFLFPAIQGAYVSPGSNAWAVSGVHAADGKPMAANDPHLAYGIPGTWHLVQLKAPGLDVSGAALPGVPAVITGHNAQIAWGVTNLQTDVMDLYVERLDLRTGRYLCEGKTQQAQLDTETIGVKGGAPVKLAVWVTKHGPVIDYDGGKAFSMRWSASEGVGIPFLDVDRAQNWQEFRQALKTFWGPAQNFVYADKAGNLGYQAAGAVPIRRGFSGDTPLDGTSSKFEWDGYIPFDELPSVYNPASGIVATANQCTFPAGYPYQVDGSFADRYRIEQIRARLGASRRLTVQQMLAVQKDVYSAYDRFLAREAVGAFDKHGSSDAMVRDAIAVLRTWNGQMDKDEAAPMITQLLDHHIARSLVAIMMQPVTVKAAKPEGASHPLSPAGQAAPKEHYELSVLPDLFPRPQIIQTVLETRPKGWIAKEYWDAWILQNLSTALEEGRKRQGSPVSKWRWGRLLQWNLEHPVGKELPLVDRFFDIGKVAMSGAGTTVKQTTSTLGPSERMVVDLGDLDKSVQNLPIGESGHVASPHYKDQWPAYYSGKSFPMQFDKVDAKQVLRVKPAP